MTSTSEADGIKNFKDLFSAPKPHLKRLVLELTKISCASMVLDVLIAKKVMLEDLFYEGPCPPFDLLQRWMRSQNELKMVIFRGGSKCLCHGDTGSDDAQQGQLPLRDIGMFWVPIMKSLLLCSSLESICCQCFEASGREIEELTQICNDLPDDGKLMSIVVCNYTYLARFDQSEY